MRQRKVAILFFILAWLVYRDAIVSRNRIRDASRYLGQSRRSRNTCRISLLPLRGLRLSKNRRCAIPIIKIFKDYLQRPGLGIDNNVEKDL